jgi:hypothetical protein
MAITQNFLIGRTRKSAGGTRFSTWKGLNVIAAKQINVKQTITEALTISRGKMAAAIVISKQLKLIIKSIFDFGIQKTTEFAATTGFFLEKINENFELDLMSIRDQQLGTGNTYPNKIASEETDDTFLNLQWNNSQKNIVFNNEDTEITVIITNFNGTKIKIINKHKIGTSTQLSINLESIFNTNEAFFYAVKFFGKVGNKKFSSKLKFSNKNDWFYI